MVQPQGEKEIKVVQDAGITFGSSATETLQTVNQDQPIIIDTVEGTKQLDSVLKSGTRSRSKRKVKAILQVSGYRNKRVKAEDRKRISVSSYMTMIEKHKLDNNDFELHNGILHCTICNTSIAAAKLMKQYSDGKLHQQRKWLRRKEGCC